MAYSTYNRICAMAAVATATMCAMTAHAQNRQVPPLNIDAAATVGAYAIDMRTGKVICAYNEGLWLTPASLTKILTTGAALQTKGADSRLRTRIELVTMDGGTYTLRIAGEFDPTTNSSHFANATLETVADQIADRLKRKGIRHIESVCVDDSRESLETQNPKMLWEDMGNYYGAPPTIVSYRDNSASLYFSTPGAVGEECTLDSVVPRIESLRIKANVTAHASAADRCQVRWLGPDSLHATGSLPRGRKAFRVRSAMPRPTMRYAEALANLLRKEGVNVGKACTGECEQGSEIMVIESPTVAEIVKETNHESVNLFADALAMNMALRHKEGGRVTWGDAAEAVTGFWKKRYNLDMHLDDGSGLSAQGAVSAKTMVKAIEAMRKSAVWEAFRTSLPIVGRSGTVSNLCAGLSVSGHARAKSGTMTGVVAYAGFVKTMGGHEVAFCIMVNHHKESTGAIRNEIAKWLNRIYNDKK